MQQGVHKKEDAASYLIECLLPPLGGQPKNAGHGLRVDLAAQPQLPPHR